MEQVGSRWKDFHEIWNVHIFRNSVVNIKFSLKSDKRNGYFTWRLIYFYVNTSLNSFYNDKCFRRNVVEKIKTHILCSISFFKKSCCFGDNMQKYVTARQATDGNIICGMRFACWITKAKNTHSECLILIAFPRRQWLRERASVLCYTTYISCFLKIIPHFSAVIFYPCFYFAFTEADACLCRIYPARVVNMKSVLIQEISSRIISRCKKT
jgi:hypothetical protein